MDERTCGTLPQCMEAEGRVDQKTNQALASLIDGLTRERDELQQTVEELRKSLAEDVQLLADQRGKLKAAECERDSLMAELRNTRMDLEREKTEKADLQLRMGLLHGTQENEYEFVEKLIMSEIMDASYTYGPVRLCLGYIDHNGDSCKRILLENAPDGVVRSILGSPMVGETNLGISGLEVRPITPDMYDIVGVV